jgi:alpha-beta hydrolase superfamily lysophospholipase
MYHHIVPELQKQSPKDLFLIDLRGQGQSKGHEGHIESMDIYLKDIESFIGFLNQEGYQTIHLICHSLGSLICANLLANAPKILGEKGTITMSAPFFGIKLPAFQKILLELISNFLGATFYLKRMILHPRKISNYKNNDLTKDKDLFQKFQNHPYRIGPPTWGWLKAIFKAHKNLEEKLTLIINPLSIFLAVDDRVVDNQITKSIFNKIEIINPKVELLEIEESEHALFLAPKEVRNKLIKKIAQFAEKFDPSNPSQN